MPALSDIVGNVAVRPGANRLPLPLTSLVGRGHDIAEVSQLLGGNRLVSLVGPGGVGKTRVALGVAAASNGSLPGPGGQVVAWVELAPLGGTGAADVAMAVADALGLAELGAREPFEAVRWEIGTAPALLVLDNCEHLIAAAAEACHQLLGACPELRVLATSREPLGVPGEAVWPVAPLALPSSTERSVSVVARYDAVQLFMQRARAASPSLLLDDEARANTVARICRRLDGLPLAIELAVGNLRAMPIEELGTSLDKVFDVLVGGPRTAPTRHQALRATLDWSHRLLGPAEQQMLRRLSVFAGDFNVAAAAAVALDGDEARAYGLLRGLVDKSLVVAGTSTGRGWYHMLATVRQYAGEQLSAAGEERQVRDAHLSWCAARAGQAERRLEGATQAVELAQLAREMNDLRAALQFAHNSGQPVKVLEIAGALGRFWYLHGNYREGREWLDRAVVNCPDAPDALRARALRASGRLAFLQCEYPAAVRRLSAALRLYRDLGDSRGTATALQILGAVDREQGRYQQATAHYSRSLDLFEALGDRWGIATAHSYLGFCAWLQREFDQARAECSLALQQFQASSDHEGTAWSLLSLGIVAQYEGDLDLADDLLSQSRRISEEIGFREGVAWCLNQQGLVAWRRHSPTAHELLLASAELHRELGDQWRLTSVLDALAAAAVQDGNLGKAARLLAAAEAVRARIGTPVPTCERPDREATTRAVAEGLGDAERARLVAGAGNLALDELLRATTAGGPSPAPSPDGRRGAAPSGSPGEETPEPLVKTAAVAAPLAEPVAPTVGAVLGPAVDDAPALSVRALGASEVRAGGRLVELAEWGYAKPRELFYLLCSSPPRTKEQLGAALWPDLDGNQLRNALHTALRDARRALGDRDWLLFANGRYSFNRSRPYRFDVAEFETALSNARRARGPDALPHWQRALAAYGGDFLPDMAAGEWAEERRRELRASYEAALSAAGGALVAAGQHRLALQVYERAVAHEPLNESAHRELMRCLERLGQPARAMRHFDELATLLRRELGASPAAETVRLYEQLRSSSGPS
ncbi:MAG TPA: BTAD domain-containing putative transcriptional regulator [Acidimicrobiales bacterium]|nr:BTAD domain-containing putative transcriptional regulator [Acidimicrobiales bacterium]